MMFRHTSTTTFSSPRRTPCMATLRLPRSDDRATSSGRILKNSNGSERDLVCCWTRCRTVEKGLTKRVGESRMERPASWKTQRQGQPSAQHRFLVPWQLTATKSFLTTMPLDPPPAVSSAIIRLVQSIMDDSRGSCCSAGRVSLQDQESEGQPQLPPLRRTKQRTNLG